MINKKFGQGKKGLLYFAQNPAFPHLTKIGKTTQLAVEDRGLSASNVPDDFIYLAVLQCDDVEFAEEKVHIHCEKFRHQSNTGRKTEFFWSGCIKDAIEYAKDLKGVSDKTNEETEEDDAIDEKGEKVKIKRPNKDFYSMGLKNEDEIFLIRKPDIKVKICSKNEVIYEGKKYKLTGLASLLFKKLDIDVICGSGFEEFNYNSEEDKSLYERWFKLNK